MPKVTVDGIAIEVPQGATVLQACELAGKEIPRFWPELERRIAVRDRAIHEAAE